jgi:hypothetical protein
VADHRAEWLLGRNALLREVDDLLCKRQNVLLFGSPDVGKTALIGALPPRELVVIDPFEQVSSHLAARIRRAMGRGTLHLAATRTLDRKHLGSVRRIMFRFTVVRVPPLPGRWMERLVRRECLFLELAPDSATLRWARSIVRLARGQAGLALAMVRVAAATHAARGSLPSPAAAFIEARLCQAGLPPIDRIHSHA